MLNKFWEKESRIIKFSGFVAAFAGIFLTIEMPGPDKARVALQNMQVFWLFLLAVLLTVLAFKFIRWVLTHERPGFAEGLKTFGLVTISVGYVLVWLVFNLYQYIAALYPERFGEFLVTSVPLATMVFIISFEGFSKKMSLFTNLLVVSFILAAAFIFLGVFFENLFLGYFHWFLMVWGLPCLFTLFFTGSVSAAFLRKQKLF